VLVWPLGKRYRRIVEGCVFENKKNKPVCLEVDEYGILREARGFGLGGESLISLALIIAEGKECREWNFLLLKIGTAGERNWKKEKRKMAEYLFSF
jgi:hypothetical protein